MAQMLHRQDSAFYAKEFQGCRWGFLQFFGFRRRSSKVISDKKHGQGKGGGRSRHRASCIPLKEEGSSVMDDDNKNTEVTNKHKGSKNSAKASLKSLIVRKLYGKGSQKEKMLPVAPKLLHTMSIHYMETKQHVHDGQSAPNDNASLLSMQNATSTTTFSTLGGCDTDTSSSLLLKSAKRKSHRSISMDGMLHKVPYGQKVSGDTVMELPRSASATYDRDGLKPYISTAGKRRSNQGFRRSRSLSESLESYSHLLDSISSSSSSQLRSKGFIRHDENLAIPSSVDGNVKVSSCIKAADGSGKPVLLEECMTDKEYDVELCIAPLPSKLVGILEEHSATSSDDQVLSSIEVSLCTDHSTSEEVDNPEVHAEASDDDQIHSSTEVNSCTVLHSEDINIAEEHAITSEVDTNVAEKHGITLDDNHIQPFDVLELIEGTCVPDPIQEIESELYLNSEQEAESPTCVLDAAFSNGLADSVKHMLDDSSLEPITLHLNDVDDSVGTDVVSETTCAESLIQENIQEDEYVDLHDLQVDPVNEDLLSYVKDIFNNSNFRSDKLFNEWYSTNMTILQEEDCQHQEIPASGLYYPDMPPDQLVVFDLTNEAMLNIYKRYYVSKPMSSRFTSFDRLKPVGHHALKALWSEVSCRLDEQPGSVDEIDALLSNDIAKCDHWVNFQRGSDHVGNKVADMVFDKLLAELTLELSQDLSLV